MPAQAIYPSAVPTRHETQKLAPANVQPEAPQTAQSALATIRTLTSRMVSAFAKPSPAHQTRFLTRKPAPVFARGTLPIAAPETVFVRTQTTWIKAMALVLVLQILRNVPAGVSGIQRPALVTAHPARVGTVRLVFAAIALGSLWAEAANA